ncbi:ABC transporter permease [Corynebacterium aquilae]|uniref:Multidrug ABC transporter permease n=1 Tax=Corynebacterium aquilae DSM 44791 TaxID=1431546 RepID=A0A1L7CG17_9CORY|nr:ABC transporter permease [Corynebacterium aquilae]APT84802.1 multidrug ABC transporter permease [Corynebacterium aquilae DSM 44791]
MSDTTTFAPGTFTPDTRRSSIASMVASQAMIESKLFLRHGEQQLLSLIIPLLSLIALAKTSVIDTPNPIDVAFPLTLAISVMSSGFTGQAIAVAFDRRYGALKRIGASGVPPWTIISGKIVAVIAVAIVQTIILTITALILGWHPTATGVATALVVLLFGVAAFTGLGLLVGGTLNAEVVLALANLIWFVLVGLSSFVVVRSAGDIHPMLNIVPSVALADGFEEAFMGHLPLMHIGVLAIWAILGGAAATKFFRFTSKD